MAIQFCVIYRQLLSAVEECVKLLLLFFQLLLQKFLSLFGPLQLILQGPAFVLVSEAGRHRIGQRHSINVSRQRFPLLVQLCLSLVTIGLCERERILQLLHFRMVRSVNAVGDLVLDGPRIEIEPEPFGILMVQRLSLLTGQRNRRQIVAVVGTAFCLLQFTESGPLPFQDVNALL